MGKVLDKIGYGGLVGCLETKSFDELVARFIWESKKLPRVSRRINGSQEKKLEAEAA